jgi:hypothetical protein
VIGTPSSIVVKMQKFTQIKKRKGGAKVFFGKMGPIYHIMREKPLKLS